MTITQSGETKDLIDPLKLALSKGIFCFNIINKVESTIAKMTKCGMFVNAGREHSVASTKAFVGQVVALCLMAVWFSERKNPSLKVVERMELVNSIKFLQMRVMQTLKEAPDQCKKVAEDLFKHN